MLKDKPEDTLINLLAEDPEEAEQIVQSLGLNPALLNQPLKQDPCVPPSTSQPNQDQDQVPSGRSTIMSVPVGETQESLDVGTTSSSNPMPSQPSLPSAAPVRHLPLLSTLNCPLNISVQPSLKKRQASHTLLHAQDTHGAMPGANDKRTHTVQSDVPLASITTASSLSSLLPPPTQATASTSSAAASPSAPTASGPTAGPSASTTLALSLIQHLPAFFSCCHIEATPDPTTIPICLPIPIICGTTQSQVIVLIITGLDMHSTRFAANNDNEFYLFMDLRTRYKWVTYNMTALGWVKAASIFNTALENKMGTCAIRKTPHTLMEKLKEVEKIIHFHLKHSNFKCKSFLKFFSI